MQNKTMNPARKIFIAVACLVTLALVARVEARGALMRASLTERAMPGTSLYQRSRVKRGAATRKLASIRAGTWGGEHIRMTVGGSGARIEYDCAHGTINQPIRLDRNGRFDVRGTHAPEAGGPVRIGDAARNERARYVGRVAGARMTLSVTLVGSGQTVGTFTLDFGAEPRVFKCR